MLFRKLAIALSALAISQVAIAEIPTTITDENTVRNHDGSAYIYDGHQTVYDSENKIHVVLEISETDEIVTIPLDFYRAQIGEEFLRRVVDFFYHRNNFFDVTAHISREIEAANDVFIIANVAPNSRAESYSGDRIPPQHMRILKKKFPGQAIFTRDEAGKITGINPEVLGMGSDTQPAEPAFDCLTNKMERFKGSSKGLMLNNGLFAISSGNGPSTGNARSLFSPKAKGRSDTPTGVYRVGLTHSQEPGKGLKKTGTNSKGENTFKRVMWYMMYWDLVYPHPSGALSNLAMHGTKPDWYDRFGRQDSSGCIRTHQQVSWCVKRDYFDLARGRGKGEIYHGGPVFENMISSETPGMDNRYRLKSHKVDPQNREIIKEEGLPVIFVIFYHYEAEKSGYGDDSFRVIDI